MAALLGGGFVLINDAGGHVSNRVWLEVVLLLGLVAWRIVMGDSKSRPTFHRKHRRNGSYEPDEIEAAPDYALMIQDQEWREEQRRQSRYKRKHKHPN
jgi:uracil-DNA glycosylase